MQESPAVSGNVGRVEAVPASAEPAIAEKSGADLSKDPAPPIETAFSPETVAEPPETAVASLSKIQQAPPPEPVVSSEIYETEAEGEPEAEELQENSEVQPEPDAGAQAKPKPKDEAKAKAPVPEEAPLSPKQIQTLLDEALDFCQAAQDFWQKGELESALEALDQAYSLILKIDVQNIPPELIQQKEDLRLIISRRILEIYASRNIVATGQHNAIPLVINKYIQAEINLFTTGCEKNFFVESYRRSGRYHDYIVSELRKAGLPEELSWLPLIESGFKVKALSRSRALGLWQFIPSTGYKFGLKRNIYIDERLDFEKSTQAAIAYLKELHQIFGDWTTALAAYNCGEGKVLQVIRSQNVNYLDDFWDLFERLPFETARYVPRFLAVMHIVKNKEKYGLDAVQVEPPLNFEIATVAKQMHLRDIAGKLGVSLTDLTELNPELRYKMLPRERYAFRVPPGKAEELLAKIDEIPVSSRPQPAYVKHRVRSGETLSVIAHRYHTSISRIVRANNIRRQNFIVAGRVLKIPQGSSYRSYPSVRTAVAEVPVKNRPSPSTHTVRGGDSLWVIAKLYGTTTREIQDVNHLTSSMLHIGQVLKIPGSVSEDPPAKDVKTYRVRHGDSPFKISQKFKIPLEQFLRMNQLTPRSKIYPGQRLFVE